MAAAARSTMKRISTAVYLSEPAATTAPPGTVSAKGTTQGPGVVLLCAWMGAQLKHAVKYVDAYRKLYPNTTVVLVRSNPIDFFRRARFVEAIQPAADLLRARVNGLAGPKSDLLVHTLSNGGCLTLQELNEQLLRRPGAATGVATTRGIPARAFIFDSCPGLSTLKSTIRAFSAGIRNPVVKYPAVAAITLMYGVLRLWSMIRRQPGTLARISAYLNSPSSLPPVPRLYLYSPIDELIPPEDVERHAAQAKTEAGVTDIRMEKFENSPHVAHARTDPERYWSAVKRVWDEAGEQKKAEQQG
ncbi:hypothetical protein C6P46_005842 [Rhodotorula mucilaginosa]|uniref:DUF829-domain-containing protein n=1 Tax=Rhodotorula mucilaginosa TaxID=5537 RepID=A0A9P6VY40_RHOMI|nr:hypothetical protein C6P46_005842 [Rhodotorula mucilaginosa]